VDGVRDDKKILDEARERYQYVNDVDNANRIAAKEDTEFCYVRGAQWPQYIRKEREDPESAEPCLEFNQLPQFINQVVNDQRQQRPGIRIHPAGGRASEDIAKIKQGMIRHIEYASNAEAAYDSGFQHAVVGGRGYWRVCSEYQSPSSFNQDIKIQRIPDPNTVYIDPDYQEPDTSDKNYAFVTERMTKDDFESRYPDAEPVSWEDQDKHVGWFDGDDGIIVADYYRRVGTKRTLLQLPDGSGMWKDEVPKGIVIPPNAKSRESTVYVVEWYKIAGGQQILEKYEWPGTIIPVVVCVGDEIMIDGKRLYQGLIRRARDPQMAYNFAQTQAIVGLMLAPRSPWQAAEGSIEGYENLYAKANRKNLSVLPYVPFDDQGRPLPPPTRQPPAQVSAGYLEYAQGMKGDLMSTIGMYENSLGRRSQEVSGRAILAREKQGDASTFHFVDNLGRAIALTGKIINEVLPAFFDTTRKVATVGTDDTKDTVTINDPVPDEQDPTQTVLKNDISQGDYTVVIETGPSYATKRQEASESMMAFVQAFPPAAQFAGDLIAKAQDWPDADVIAERLELMLPPAIQQAKAAKDQGQKVDPQVQAAQAQVQQVTQQAQQAIGQLQAEIQKLQSGAEAKMRAAQVDAQVALDRAQLDAQTKLQVARMEAETKLLIAQITVPQELSAKQQGDGSSEISMLAQSVAALAKAATAPRQHRLTYDEQGNVVGGTSVPVVQGAPALQ